MASMRSSSFEISHFDQAIKSSVSKLGDKRLKEITSLQRKVILGFLEGRDTFACLPTGYGKSLIYQLAARVAAELSVVYNYKDLFSIEPVVVSTPLNALIKAQLSSFLARAGALFGQPLKAIAIHAKTSLVTFLCFLIVLNYFPFTVFNILALFI